ncbi:MAG: ATP-binding protein [Phycisphaerales bacterium]
MATWKPQPQDLSRVFAEQNPWHTTSEVPDILAPPIERTLARLLWQRVLADEPRRFQLILGPRRVGKTTVMYQTVRHLLQHGVAPQQIWWLRLDHPLLLRENLGDLVRFIVAQSGATPESPSIVLMDELVYSEQWDLWLKTFYDDNWPVKIVATSSATAALRDRRHESGVGRWNEQYLTPYLFSEFLDLLSVSPVAATSTQGLLPIIAEMSRKAPDLRNAQALRDVFLLIGGFPELLTKSDTSGDQRGLLLNSQQVLRNDAVERAIYKDIPQSFGVDNPMMLERLLYVLAGQATGVLSPTNLCQELGGLSQPTFDKYLSYLEKAFLVFTLPNYSGREAAIQRRGRKLYFVDGAIRNAALQRGLAPLEDPIEQGMLLENLVAATAHALATQSGFRLFHWRHKKDEVDLILDQPGDPLALEVGRSPSHSRHGLRALIAQHPRFRGHAYLLAPNMPFLDAGDAPDGIGSASLDLFLLACGQQATANLAQRILA